MEVFLGTDGPAVEVVNTSGMFWGIEIYLFSYWWRFILFAGVFLSVNAFDLSGLPQQVKESYKSESNSIKLIKMQTKTEANIYFQFPSTAFKCIIISLLSQSFLHFSTLGSP